MITSKDLRTVVIDEKRFGHLTLTTGPIFLPFRPGHQSNKVRVIAFNWAAFPVIHFHSLN